MPQHFPMELRHIRYVLAAVEHGSFRRAAAALGVEQSVVSRRIRDLEDGLGASLFVRQHAGVVLTYAGEVFVKRARFALDEIDDARSAIGAIGRGEDGAVRIGILSGQMSPFLAQIFRMFEERYDRVRLALIEATSGDHVDGVLQDRIDIAFLTGRLDFDGCDSVGLWNEKLYAVVPEKSELSKRSEIHWNDLARHRVIVSNKSPWPALDEEIDRHFGKADDRPTICPCDVGWETILRLVALGRGTSILSETATIALPADAVRVKLFDGGLLFGALWSETNDNPAFRRFLSLTKSLAALHQKP